jgi:hypothetical protein
MHVKYAIVAPEYKYFSAKGKEKPETEKLVTNLVLAGM